MVLTTCFSTEISSLSLIYSKVYAQVLLQNDINKTRKQKFFSLTGNSQYPKYDSVFKISGILQEKFINSTVAFIQSFCTCVGIIFICSAFRCVFTFHIKQISFPKNYVKNFHMIIYVIDIFKFIS